MMTVREHVWNSQNSEWIVIFIRVDIPPLEDIPDVKQETSKPVVVRQVEAPVAGIVK